MTKRLPPAALFPAGDPRFRVSDVRLPAGERVRVVECGGVTAEDVVVCVHGWGCSAYTYHDVLPALASAGRRAVAIDLPGHGLSDKPEDPAYYTLDRLMTSLRETLDALGVTRPLLVGHSMGGAVVARLAAVAPERVRALVLCAPVGFGSAVIPRVAAWLTPRVVAGALPYLVPRRGIALALRAVYGSLRPPTARDCDEYWAPTQFPAFVRAMRQLLHTFDWQVGEHGGLAGILAPATILSGGEDPIVSREAAGGYARVIPGAVLRHIPESGHVIPEEAPEAVIEAVLASGGQAS